jgi:hypothetical protein
MSSRRITSVGTLAALTSFIAACFPSGPPAGPLDDIYYPKVRTVDVKAQNGSGVSGKVTINEWDQPFPKLEASVYLGTVSGANSGARYAVHIHAGFACDGVKVPIVHDLGAPTPVASYDGMGGASAAITIGRIALPVLHTGAGYYLDVHMPDPNSAVIGCATL